MLSAAIKRALSRQRQSVPLFPGKSLRNAVETIPYAVCRSVRGTQARLSRDRSKKESSMLRFTRLLAILVSAFLVVAVGAQDAPKDKEKKVPADNPKVKDNPKDKDKKPSPAAET